MCTPRRVSSCLADAWSAPGSRRLALNPQVRERACMTATAPSSREPQRPHLASPDENPSFTKAVFLGEIREDLVFPFPSLDAGERESLSMILDSFRAFAAGNIDSAKFDHEGEFPAGVRSGLHELGLMGLSIPEDYGGFGAAAKG